VARYTQPLGLDPLLGRFRRGAFRPRRGIVDEFVFEHVAQAHGTRHALESPADLDQRRARGLSRGLRRRRCVCRGFGRFRPGTRFAGLLLDFERQRLGDDQPEPGQLLEPVRIPRKPLLLRLPGTMGTAWRRAGGEIRVS